MDVDQPYIEDDPVPRRAHISIVPDFVERGSSPTPGVPRDGVLADGDLVEARADQLESDADQWAADADQEVADVEQRASDRDQAAADRAYAATVHPGVDYAEAHETSRAERAAAACVRRESTEARARAGLARSIQTSRRREAGRLRDVARRAARGSN